MTADPQRQPAGDTALRAVLDRLAGPPDEAVRQLADYVRRPSISATGEGIRDTAGYIAERMNRWGIEATVVETAGLPAVLGRTPPRPGRFTLLVYGHYDVQPPDRLHAWHSPPFTPNDPGRSDLRPGHRRQQGPAPGPPARHPRLARGARRDPVQRRGAAGRRGGDRQPAPSGPGPRPRRRTRRRPGRVERRAGANPDEANHAPNENLELARYLNAMPTAAAILGHLPGRAAGAS